MANGYNRGPQPLELPNVPWLMVRKYLVPGFIALILLAAATSCWYTVKADEEALILRLGKYHKTAGPGLHFKVPFGIDRVLLGKVKRVYNEEFGFRTVVSSRVSKFDYSDRERAQDESLMLTGDLNCADVQWVIRYRIKDLKKYLFNVQNVRSTLRQASKAVMRRIVGDRSIDEVLTIGRREIELQVENELQAKLKDYGCGLAIQTVKLKGVNPPQAVKSAFDRVNQAVQVKDRIINEAEGQKNREIPNAEGKKIQIIKEAEGYETKRKKQAEGDTKAFLAVLKEYREAKDVTRRRLYLETMSEILSKCQNIYIIDKEQQGLLPFLNLGNKSLSGGR